MLSISSKTVLITGKISGQSKSSRSGFYDGPYENQGRFPRMLVSAINLVFYCNFQINEQKRKLLATEIDFRRTSFRAPRFYSVEN